MSLFNRSTSLRSKQHDKSNTSSKHRFNMASLRGQTQPDMSKKLYKLIKSEREAINSYESASRERHAVATQLSEWGEETNDDAVSDLSDKLGVLLSELGEQEDQFGQNLEESRNVLKTIRNTEKSVAPSRDHKAKVADEIQKLKYKEPQSPKIAELEQELVRAEAQSLVAEAQLTNITRQKFKESYDIQLAAHIERAEKQIILAQHARRLLMLMDDTPVVPGDAHPTFAHTEEAREILNRAEDDLREWQPSYEPISSNAGGLASNAMPNVGHQQQQGLAAPQSEVGGYTTGSEISEQAPTVGTNVPDSSLSGDGATHEGQFVPGNSTGQPVQEGSYTTA